MNRYLPRVRQQLARCIERIDVPQLRLAASHLLGLGKLYRPQLLQATYKSLTDKEDGGFVDLAVAVEILHTATLIHDDLPSLDDAHLRRGVTAVHCEFDEATAILAGDALLNLSFSYVLECKAPELLRLELLRSLSQAAASVMEGQALDIAGAGQQKSQAEMVELYEKKTGALLGACCEMGALLANAPTEQVKQLHRVGVLIGVAFQVCDDLLSVTGTEVQTGKTLSADQAKGKQTSPDILGISGARDFAEEIMEEAKRLTDALDLRRPSVLLETARMAVDRDR